MILGVVDFAELLSAIFQSSKVCTGQVALQRNLLVASSESNKVFADELFFVLLVTCQCVDRLR